MKSFIAATCAAVLIGSAASAATTIVQNGSFEDGAVMLNGQGWGNTATLPGWTGGTLGIEVQTNPTLGFIDAQDGGRYVELDTTANSSMSQSITFASIGTYLLEFWYAPRDLTKDTNGIDFGIGSVTGTVGTPLVSVVNGWTKVSATFAVTALTLTQTLSFTATTTSDSIGGLVDNVSIAAVPTPAAGFMLLGALGGLVALRRRKAVAAV